MEAGPSQRPTGVPCAAPSSVIRWMEKGASMLSANQRRIEASCKAISRWQDLELPASTSAEVLDGSQPPASSRDSLASKSMAVSVQSESAAARAAISACIKKAYEVCSPRS
eukprot:4831355-Pleurochrysis_carterae.AAC.2